MTKVAVLKNQKEKSKKKESSEKHSALLKVLDKNGDGIVARTEQPWKDAPEGFKWFLGLYTFSWLAKFQKSPVVGTAADQSAAIKETVNTIGLVAALVVTITVPVAMNPNDVEFKTNTELWGSEVQIMDEAATTICFFVCIYLAIAFHIVSIGGAILSVVSVSCLSGNLLVSYIEEVGSILILFPFVTFIIGCIFFIVACLDIAIFTFGVPLVAILFALFASVAVFLLFPLVHVLVKYLYRVPKKALKDIEKAHNDMAKVKVEQVAEWLQELLNKKEYYSEKLNDEAKNAVLKTFREQGISGLALPSVDEDFLRGQCNLTWGDAHLLMREIELRKGHVVHWLPEKIPEKTAKTGSTSPATPTES